MSRKVIDLLNPATHAGVIECPCGCLDQWEHHGSLGYGQIFGCSNCQHIQYATEGDNFLNENGEVIKLS